MHQALPSVRSTALLCAWASAVPRRRTLRMVRSSSCCATTPTQLNYGPKMPQATTRGVGEVFRRTSSAESLAAEPLAAEPLAAEPLTAESLVAESLAAEPLSSTAAGRSVKRQRYRNPISRRTHSVFVPLTFNEKRLSVQDRVVLHRSTGPNTKDQERPHQTRCCARTSYTLNYRCAHEASKAFIGLVHGHGVRAASPMPK
jgi:hypothetical protein